MNCINLHHQHHHKQILLSENILDTDDEIYFIYLLFYLKPTHTYFKKSPKTPTIYFSQKNSNKTLEEEINLQTPINAHNIKSATPNLTPSSR